MLIKKQYTKKYFGLENKFIELFYVFGFAVRPAH